LAKQAAEVWQNPGDGKQKSAPVNRYIHALTYCLLDRTEDAVPLLKRLSIGFKNAIAKLIFSYLVFL